MIFLVLVGIVAIIVIVLNMMDNSNLDTIRQYFIDNNCTNITYSKGSYKGICGEKVVEIHNSFNVDLKENKKSIDLEKIKKINEKKLVIIINDDYEIEFKDKQNKEIFYNNLKEHLNK